MTRKTRVWRPVTDTQAGFLYNLSDAIRTLEESNPGVLVPLNNGRLIIASDYSGQHKGASHEAYSFLVTSEHAVDEWLPLLENFRREWLPDGRRLSFKKLNEPVRHRALPAFLDTASCLPGNLITILVERRVGSFMFGGPEATIDVFPDCFSSDAKHGTVEKMLRLASFVALILSGLRDEHQVSSWISDHDETLDTNRKREQFARLASYLTFGLTRWRHPAENFFVTTELPDSPYWGEDIAAVADIVAGTYCKLSSFLPSFFGTRNWAVKVDTGSIDDERALAVGNWLAKRTGSLRSVLVRLESRDTVEVSAAAQAFADRS